MLALQVPGATELLVIVVNVLVVIAILAGGVYAVRRVMPRRDVPERLDGIERKLDALEAEVGDRDKDESEETDMN